MNWRTALVVPLILATAAPPGMAQVLQREQAPLPDLGDISAATMSPQMERRIGEEAMRQIRADPAYADDPEINDYLNTLGAKLAAAGPGGRQDFEFFLIRDNTINAFAMPGGYVGVHSGLLLSAQTESELASVLGHEVSHVTQHHIARMVGRQSQLSIISIAGVLLGLLAARSNSQVGSAAIMASQAGAASLSLGYSRDYEREADRVGFDRLRDAGFDVTGMVAFFERLGRSTAIQEASAPGYLQTHPLTIERIADIQNRAQHTPYRQYVDKPEFQLARAKLKAEQGTPRDARTYFETQLKERRFASETAARYGLVSALLRTREQRRAETELAALRANSAATEAPAVASPMIDMLAMRVKIAGGDVKGALAIGRAAQAKNPNYRPLQYAMVRAQQSVGQHAEALTQLTDLVRYYPRDNRLYRMQAESYTATNQQLLAHQAQAEAYYLQGALPAAIEQLQLAQKAGDGNFYQLSAVDARLREIRDRNAEEMREQKRR